MSNTASGLLDEIVARILEIARPEKIILFGSAVHGKMGPNSQVFAPKLRQLPLVINLSGLNAHALADGNLQDNNNS